MMQNKRLKTILTTFNSKYIHTSLALRWLYVANKDSFDISFREYTIKERVEQVADELLSTNCDVIGVSVSIWNVEQSRQLVELLKNKKPELIVVVGGPEVSYEPQFFMENWSIDYLISGEGEFVLGKLLSQLENGGEDIIQAVSTKSHISKQTAQADIAKLEQCDSPYQLLEDRESMKNRIVYFETSRGCPYRCQYCLSSLEKGIRYFSKTYIINNLKYLIESDTRKLKFLDRTFNLNKQHTEMVFGYLLEHHRADLSCQFEIYADLLTDDTIAYLNEKLVKDYFRFEIGIQSTYEPTNMAVKRVQNFPLLLRNIKQLMAGGKIDLHLDLIAGLPYESFERFVKSFNDVFELGAKELQLGFLKMLRGTNLRRYADKYGYKYQEQAPYEILYNDYISADELRRIHDAEDALEKFWNSGRFKRTMQFLIKGDYQHRYFELFDDIAHHYNHHKLPHIGYSLEDLFRNLYHFLELKEINASAQLRDDYYDNFTQRPRSYWMEDIDKKERKRLLYLIGQDREFLEKYQLNRQMVEKQAAINPLHDNKYLLTIFDLDKNKEMKMQIEYQVKASQMES